MALCGYDELNKFPMFHLLSLDYWHIVAETLNWAILGDNIYIYACRIEKLKDNNIYMFVEIP